MTQVRVMALLLIVMLLAACGGASGPAAPAATAPQATTAPAADQPTAAPVADGEVDRSRLAPELRFYNWSDYIDPTIAEDFEKEYGVKVIIDVFDANEDMIAKVRAGGSGYDLISPSDYAVETMWRENLLQKIDKTLLTNMKNLDPGLMNKYFDPDNQYSIPYMFGITGIAYNATAFPTPPDSWAAVFDKEQLEKVRGQISMLDDEREVPGAALKFLGQSLNETDPEILKQVERILIAQKEYLAAYNSSDVNRKLAAGEYMIAHAWSGQAMQARNGLGDEFPGNPDIRFVMPKEGGMIWMDNLVILADSPNAYTAHVFIDYLLRPDVAARNTEYIGYLTPNIVARDLLSDEIKALYAEGFAPDEAMYNRLEWAIRNEETSAFTDLWTVVKGQ